MQASAGQRRLLQRCFPSPHAGGWWGVPSVASYVTWEKVNVFAKKEATSASLFSVFGIGNSGGLSLPPSPHTVGGWPALVSLQVWVAWSLLTCAAGVQSRSARGCPGAVSARTQGCAAGDVVPGWRMSRGTHCGLACVCAQGVRAIGETAACWGTAVVGLGDPVPEMPVSRLSLPDP